MRRRYPFGRLAWAAAALAGLAAGLVLAGGARLAPVGEAQTGASPSSPPVVSRNLPDFALLAEQAMPAVLAVTTEDVISSRDFRRIHPDLDPFEFFFGPNRIPRQKAFGAGSAFFISADGLALTNNHVIAGADKIYAVTNDGTRMEARVVGRDPATDLALIKVQGKGTFPFLPLGDSDTLKVGEWVMAVGNPLGIGHTVTVGVVSGKGRTLRLSQATMSFENFIQTDAAINRGNSGGPLMNLKGEVVGINTAMSAGAENMGFAVPVNTAKAILPQLKEKGKVVRGYLGVNIANISADDQEAFNLPSREGALVHEVMEGSPAEKAGIQHGDVILGVNGKPIKSQRELIDTVSALPPGTKVQLEIIRDGKRKTLTAVLAERKTEGVEEDEEKAAPKEAAAKLGLEVASLSPRLRREYNVPNSVDGVLVTDVEDLSVADEAGIAPGDVILEVNGKEVNSVDEFNARLEQLRSGQVVRLYLYRQGAKRFAVVRMP
ncbi:MAG: Do family serine endopeptidase [Thermoanaerobaculum sp.]|nr:Do family serine endopeptidase [Thermoanaerobaculum sp.]